VLWEEHLATRARGALVGALVLCALTAVSRPELTLLAPVLYALTAVAAGHRRRPWRDPAFVAGALLCALACLPHMLHVAAAVEELQARASLPHGALSALAALPDALGPRNSLIDPSLYPVALRPLGLAAVLLPGKSGRRPAVLLALMALLAVAVYVFDLDRANMARVHVPAAVLWTVLAAGGHPRDVDPVL
jgi:4-amino-4-deoxy-L-arabinose transferase-like glycosyltransferase